MLQLPFKSLYLSAVTPQGIVSRTEEVVNDSRFSKVILLKGGTAELKSDLLKYSAAAANRKGADVKTALSAVDDGAVEAVFFGDTAVIDGSMPFNIEPPFFGSKFQTLWLGDVYDYGAAAQNRDQLEKLYNESEQLSKSAHRLLFAADCLLSDNRRIALAAADKCKLEKAAYQTAEQFISKSGKETFIIVSGRGGKAGIESGLADYEVTAFKDSYGSCADLFLSLIYSRAKRSGCAFCAGFSPFYPYAFPKILLFPASGKAVFHADGGFCLNRKPDKVITAKRFTDKGMLHARRRQLDANQKAAQKLLSRSEELFGGAAAARNFISRVAVGGAAADGQLRQQLCRRLCDLLF